MIVLPEQQRALQSEFDHFDQACRAPTFRTMSQFACEEIWLASGPFKGQQYNLDRQPWARLWFGLVESARFVRYAVTGPTQNGKSLTCYVIPALYYLFELGENVCCGIPQMEMAREKWERDFLPVIMASRYRDLLPDDGIGSRGGKFESITFKNGAILKFMSAKGGDEKRSGVTFRVLVMTEVDKYDRPSETSREEDPISQMIARLDAFKTKDTVVFMECTCSTEDGRIWIEYTNGSMARIALKCPHCGIYVTPEREHLVGWQDADNEVDARANAYFACPDCGAGWTQEQRRIANETAKLVHKGQEITPDGEIVGPLPKTLTAGFRWNAANNLLREAEDFGGAEWSAREKVADEVSKSIQQFLWAKPVKSGIVEQMPLDLVKLLARTHAFNRGIVPPDCESVAVGLDIGGWWCHWTAIAFGKNAHGYIVDYGRIAVPQAALGLEAGIMEALREFRQLCEKGWTRSDGAQIFPDENLVDSGWKTTIVYEFIAETGLPFRAAKGMPVGGQQVSYYRPKTTGSVVRWIGDGWHISALKDDFCIDLLEVDADQAKTSLHARLNCEVTAPGAITMFQIDRRDQEMSEERRQFVRQLTAEKSTEEFKPGRGTVIHWEKIRPQNHYLDSSSLALVGGSICGVSVIDQVGESQNKDTRSAAPLETPVIDEPKPEIVSPIPRDTTIVIGKTAPLREMKGFIVREPSVRETRGGWVRSRGGQ